MDRNKVYLATVDENAHRLAREYGLGIELSEFCTAYFMDEKFHEVEASVAEKVRCTDRLVLHAPFNELFPCAIDPQARELARRRYRQAIALAQGYGAKKVVIHGGYNHWIYFPVWYVEQSVPFWKEFEAEIPEGMTVCLENVLEESSDMLIRILEAVGSPKIRMCLDIGHAHAYSKEGIMNWLTACAPWIDHFHIHNNDGSWDYHRPLPEGTIPMKELLTKAQTLCPDATYTLELPEAESSVRWLLEEHLLEIG